MTAKYAAGTKVGVEASRGEISGILAKHGVMRQATASEPEGDTIQFELDGHAYRFFIARPTLEEIQAAWRAAHPSSLARPPHWPDAVEQEWRRRWRAHVLLLKAKLEFAAAGDSTIARELMPYMLLRDGRTMEQALEADAIPLLTAGGRK